MTPEDAGATPETIEWADAQQLLASGRIVLVAQSHSRSVRLADEAGHAYVTEEPEIDAVLQEVQALPQPLRDKIALLSE